MHSISAEEEIARDRVDICVAMLYLDTDSVELIEASPGPCLGQTPKYVSHGLVVHLVRTVEHVTGQG
jgi:hypothetical protein